MIKKLLLSFMLLTIFIPSTLSLAETASDEEEIPRLSEEYPDNRYDLMTYADDKWYNWAQKTGTSAISSIKNFLWNINVLIANITLMVIYQLFSLDIVELTKDSVMEIASGTAGSLVNNLGGFALAIASIGIVIRAYIKQDWQAFFKIVTLIIISFSLLFSIQSKSFNYVDLAHSVSVNLENAVMKVNPSMTNSKNFEVDPKGNNLGDDVSIQVENKAFVSLLYKPYLLLQYGTTDEDVINNEDSYNGDLTRIDEYLSANPSTEDGVELREDIAEYELKDLNNESIFAGNGYLAGGYTMGIIVSTLIQAVVFFFLALMRIMLQFGFVILLIMFPFMLFASIFPTFETMFGKYLKGLWMLILFKGLVVFFILVATSFITLSYEMADLSDDIYYRIFIQVIFSISIIFLYTKRDFVTNMFNGADINVEGVATSGLANGPRMNNMRRSMMPGKRSKNQLRNVGKKAGRLTKNGMTKVAGISASATKKGKNIASSARGKVGGQLNKAKNYVSQVQNGEIPGQKESPYHNTENRNLSNKKQDQINVGNEGGIRYSNKKENRKENVQVSGENVSVNTRNGTLRNPNNVTRIDSKQKQKSATSKFDNAKPKKRNRSSKIMKENNSTKVNNSNKLSESRKGAGKSSRKTKHITQWEAQEQIKSRKRSADDRQKGRNPYQSMNEQNIQRIKEESYEKSQERTFEKPNVRETDSSKYSLKKEGLLGKRSLLHGRNED